MSNLLKGIKEKSDRIIVVGYTLCDEAKTMPKTSPFTGEKSFFSCERITMFNNELMKLCSEMNIETACIDIEKQEWIDNYLFEDGLHPNDKGHKAIFDKVIELVKI